jgi:hypothetical protein
MPYKNADLYSDYEKINMWNTVCMSKGWAKPGELETWLQNNGVKFTGAGSAVPAVSIGTLSKDWEVDAAVDKTSDEGYATLILQILSGVITVGSAELEERLWWKIIDRSSKEFSLPFPEEVLPKRIRDKIQ